MLESFMSAKRVKVNLVDHEKLLKGKLELDLLGQKSSHEGQSLKLHQLPGIPTEFHRTFLLFI